MNSKQSKRAMQNFDQAMRVAEHRSYANLSSSFEVPSIGRVSVPFKNNHLRVTKSFHGDISDAGSRLPNGSAKSQSYPHALSNGFTLLRQSQTAISQKKRAERQKTKVLKPLNVTKNQVNGTKFSDIGQEFSSAILPESGTASYRLTHDVSFDEGTRYKNATVAITSPYKMIDNFRDGTARKKSNLTNDDHRTNQTTRFDLLTDCSNKRPPTNHIQTLTFKEPPSYSFLRFDDRRATSRIFSPHGGGISPTYIHSASSNSVPTTRSGKDTKSNWNQRFNDLSINGGGFYNPTPVQVQNRTESTNGFTSLGVNPPNNFSQKVGFRSVSREKNLTPSKPRYSTKSRMDSQTYCSSRDPTYADPYIGASPSFHQRLNELSLLEAETIKYEKTRKFKRKSKSDS